MSERAVDYLNTGNEFISIPNIAVKNSGLSSVGFMHKGFRACVELRGSGSYPLLKPSVAMDGYELFDGKVDHELISYWIPKFNTEYAGVRASFTVFAPLERRGFVCVLELENSLENEIEVKAGITGCWETSLVTANMSRTLSGAKYGGLSSWRDGIPVMEFRGQTPLFAVAFATEEVMPAEIWADGSDLKATHEHRETVSTPSGSPIYYSISDSYKLGAGQRIAIPVYIGVGLEEISAVASAHELRLQNWSKMLHYMQNWLNLHTIDCCDEYFKHMINLNSFFNYFFSQGLSLDTEEVIMTSSRSSANEHCGAYLDRDAMRWTLPAILQMSWSQARSALIYAFNQQLKNVGTRTRFIDGIVLEPGFQLDQLCAPIRAMSMYVQHTGDMSIVFDRRVQLGVNTIQQILAAQRHPEVALFETLLLPSGEPSRLPYVCFSNILVWRILKDIAWLYERIRDIDRVEEAAKLANQVKESIRTHFIVDGPTGKMYAQSVDLEGNFIIGDDPTGSLQMMTYFKFCAPNDPEYMNTVAWIHSNMNPNSGSGQIFEAPPASGTTNPSLVSVVNDLLTGRKDEALDFLRRASLDNGIACKSVDPRTGQASSGLAFAACAGYLASGLRGALDAICPPTARVEQKRRPSESLYEPPPEISLDTKKARM